MSDSVQVNRVLVRVPNWVGDVVHSLPAIAALRSHFADAELTVVSRGEAGTVLQHHPAVDHVVGYRTVRGFGQLRHLRKTAARLRRESYDLGVVLTNSFESAWLFWWAGIPRRYGFATDGRGWLFTEPQPCTAKTRRLHQADYYLALLAGLGVKAPRGWQRLEPTAAERDSAMRRLVAAGWRPERPLIALCPGAGFGSAKRWPLDRFGALGERLAKDRGATLVVLGGAAEQPMGEALVARIGEGSINLTGETSLRDALAIVSLSTVVVSNDSGLLHLAAASGTPVVALFGPTDPNRTGPTVLTPSSVTIVRRSVSCSPCELRECPIDHRCMVWIDPDEVYEAVCRSVPAAGPIRGVGASPTEIQSLSGSSSPHGPPQTKAPVVFLDRDGTLNRDIGYLCDPDQLELLPGVASALRALRESGARIVIVTNQSGIARGALTEAQLHRIHQRLRHVLEAEGASIDGIFYCPHHPDDRCRCRKPETGLIDRARKELALECDRSYVVGDKLADVRLAHRIGATSILVRTGHGEQVLKSWPESERSPDRVADDLPGAIQWLLGQWQSESIASSWAGATGAVMGNRPGSAQ
jgi:heptosyltransferase-2